MPTFTVRFDKVVTKETAAFKKGDVIKNQSLTYPEESREDVKRTFVEGREITLFPRGTAVLRNIRFEDNS